MKKTIFFISLLFLSLGCQEEDPLPFYEVLPIAEITNVNFGYNDISRVMIAMHVSVNGVENYYKEFELPFWYGRSCSLIRATGDPVNYEGTAILKMWVEVFYQLEGMTGWVKLDNFDPNGEYRQYTFIRVLFEVRDRNNPSNKYVGIEELSNPLIDPDNPFPSVEWQVGDFNIPGITSDAGARIGACDCE